MFSKLIKLSSTAGGIIGGQASLRVAAAAAEATDDTNTYLPLNPNVTNDNYLVPRDIDVDYLTPHELDVDQLDPSYVQQDSFSSVIAARHPHHHHQQHHQHQQQQQSTFGTGCRAARNQPICTLDEPYVPMTGSSRRNSGASSSSLGGSSSSMNTPYMPLQEPHCKGPQVKMTGGPGHRRTKQHSKTTLPTHESSNRSLSDDNDANPYLQPLEGSEYANENIDNGATECFASLSSKRLSGSLKAGSVKAMGMPLSSGNGNGGGGNGGGGNGGGNGGNGGGDSQLTINRRARGSLKRVPVPLPPDTAVGRTVSKERRGDDVATSPAGRASPAAAAAGLGGNEGSFATVGRKGGRSEGLPPVPVVLSTGPTTFRWSNSSSSSGQQMSSLVPSSASSSSAAISSVGVSSSSRSAPVPPRVPPVRSSLIEGFNKWFQLIQPPSDTPEQEKPKDRSKRIAELVKLAKKLRFKLVGFEHGCSKPAYFEPLVESFNKGNVEEFLVVLKVFNGVSRDPPVLPKEQTTRRYFTDLLPSMILMQKLNNDALQKAVKVIVKSVSSDEYVEPAFLNMYKTLKSYFNTTDVHYCAAKAERAGIIWDNYKVEAYKYPGIKEYKRLNNLYLRRLDEPPKKR